MPGFQAGVGVPVGGKGINIPKMLIFMGAFGGCGKLDCARSGGCLSQLKDQVRKGGLGWQQWSREGAGEG